ncbi:MFS transporter [Pseudonocardia oceani]|uniref:MFS transporter n=4 Tax=Pseudonocardia oceani TaxID=2792013 RepID=A0ABS6UBE8_9PSEU|nr:MFS transporter [Pseudonocardia oceani]MBW0129567.1 MFS transporter [Pseudonocardia oceani]
MPGFGRLYLGSVALSVAVFVPLAHLPGYAQAHGLGLPFAAAMLSTSSLAGIVGRLLSGPVADRVGAESGMRACALGLAAASGWWIAAGPSPTAVVVFAVLFGLANGGYVGLFPELLISRFGAAGLGARLGLLHTASAVAALVGPLSAGALTAWTGDPTAAIVLTTGAALTGWTVLRTEPSSVAPPGGIR